MRKPKAIVSVISDLNTDQRVHKVSSFLHENGFDVLLVGRRKKSSAPLPPREYATKRFRLLFEKGAKFYAAFNLRLFWFLLWHRADLLVANDLDTLLPAYLVSKLKRERLVYDSHEFFTEVPELINRPRVRNVWLRIERFIVPKLKDVYTVNESIASAYQVRYQIPVKVVRNVSPQWKPDELKTKAELGIPENLFLLIMQGAGLNIDRGVEEAIDAVAQLEGVVLMIVGDGDIIPAMRKSVEVRKLGEKVKFYGKRPYGELLNFTWHADIGLSLDKPTNPNYQMSLPNKIFDYIHTHTPIVCSPVSEVQAVVERNKVGEVITEVTPEAILRKIEYLRQRPELLAAYRENCTAAAVKESWEHETEILKSIYLP